MKKDKSISGGILLEVIFMLAIMVAIFPFIQSNAKKKSDTIRNQMVVRDLVKLKTALENYLKRNPTFRIEEGETRSVNEVPLTDLYESGLDRSFQSKNVLGQTYKIKVKTSTDGNGNIVYDAIILASGETSIPTMRIRDIVKDSKGYAGYVENNMVYGPGWQFSIADGLWGDGFDASSLVVRAGLSKKEYKYISRKTGGGTSTMETDLHMNLKSIVGINNLYIAGNLEVSEFNISGSVNMANGTSVDKTSSFDKITITPTESESGAMGKTNLEVNNEMTVSGVLKFPFGLLASTLTYSDSDLVKLVLNKELIANNLYSNDITKCVFSGGDVLTSCNKLRYIKTDVLSVPVQTILAVSNLLKFNSGSDAVLAIANLKTKTFDSEKKVSGANVFKFTDVKVGGTGNANYNITSTGGLAGINLNDIIVTEVNRKLMSKSRKVGGIDLSEKTPLSVVLRGLYYEYADIHKLAESYPSGNNAFLPFELRTAYRCEYIECGSSSWYH
ncbi:MAG: hypothetical protein IJ638_03060 [Alphaproteobacteria bacterium]|nr:hypothetical protein [Alphaproteobacteria bacterium]